MDGGKFAEEGHRVTQNEIGKHPAPASRTHGDENVGEEKGQNVGAVEDGCNEDVQHFLTL